MVEVALFGWIAVCLILFACLTPVRALTFSYVGGWLILPMLKISVQGFVDLDKIVSANIGALLGTILFAPHVLRGYRIHFVDVAVLLFCTSTFVSSMANGLGAYDGLSSAFQGMLYFGFPFLLGRLIIRNRADFLEASRIMVAAAAVYAVFALWEWRMSPQIHSTLYGVFQHRFIQHHRWGFFRPILCFPHALSLGMFMAWASALAIWLHRSGRLGPILGVPPPVLVALPVLGLLASMSMSPWALAAAALALLFFWQKSGRRIWLAAPLFFVVVWMAGRYTGTTDGKWLIALAAGVSAERADSLQYRIEAETAVLDNARQKPAFGYGRGKHQAGQEENARRFASDGLWIIMLGRYGLVGLSLFFLWWCWPLLMVRHAGRELESDPAMMAQLVAIGIEAMNFMFNGVTSPPMTLLCGGLVSSLIQLRKAMPVCRFVRQRSPVHLHRHPVTVE